MGSEVPAGTQPFSDPDESPAEASMLRMLLGAQLRRLREAAGISPEKAGYEIRGSRSKISRMENGRVGFKMRDIEDLLTVYGLTDEDQRSQVLTLARRSSAPDWWAKYGGILPGWFENYLGLESAAKIIRSFEVQFVPGLFQTEDYARAVTRLGHHNETAAEIDRRVALRIARQDALTRPEPPQVRLQVIPFSPDCHAGASVDQLSGEALTPSRHHSLHRADLQRAVTETGKARHMSNNELAAENGGQHGRLPFDTSVAHQARVYDYLLGGKNNYAADRAAAEAWLKANPETAFTVRANRAFLGRAVGYLAREAGVRQFLDIGTGIPGAGNTHEVAQAIAPESRVVYVDYDPIVLAHARALLDSSESGATEYIDADLRDTGKILSQAAELLDFTKPVAVTLIAILHAIPDSDDPHAIVAKLMDAVPPGSYLAISHMGSDLIPPETWQEMKDIASRMSQQQYWYRTREEVARFFECTDLIDPGIVRLEEWRPELGTDRGRSFIWSAVGRKHLYDDEARRHRAVVARLADQGR